MKTESKSTPQPRQPHRIRRWIVRGFLVLLMLLIGGELFARYYLGLGDPALLQLDSEMEYRFQPNQTCHRFGHIIHYNSYSQRSDDFPAIKVDPHELRVMVLGDSVINGGALTDQKHISTAVLQKILADDLHRSVVVMNCSASSWGPPNELAYLKHFGFLGADVLVLELASHDYADAPTFEDYSSNPAFPLHRPLLALQEGFTRYVLPRMFRKPPPPEGPTPGQPPGFPSQVSQKDIDWCLASEKEIYDIARKAGIPVMLVQYPESNELHGQLKIGHDLNRDVAIKAGVPAIEMIDAYRAVVDSGQSPYQPNDSIHPNLLGQRIFAEALRKPIETVIAAKESTTERAR